MIAQETVVQLSAAVTGNVTSQELVQAKNGRTFGSSGIEGGGRIVLGTATSVDVQVVDATGVVLLATTTITSNTTIDPVPRAVKGPLTVTTTNISNAAHTVTIYWSVKK